MAWHCVSACRRGRFGNHGGAARRRQCRTRAARQHARDGRDADRPHPHLWCHLGRPFNPAVTLSFAIQRTLSWRDAGLYVVAQIAGGVTGVVIAHLMFNVAPIDASTTVRTGIGQWVAEFVAAFGLVATILGCLRARPEAVPYAVGLFISAGYWFTSSTSFANPAVAIARMFTDTFSAFVRAMHRRSSRRSLSARSLRHCLRLVVEPRNGRAFDGNRLTPIAETGRPAESDHAKSRVKRNAKGGCPTTAEVSASTVKGRS